MRSLPLLMMASLCLAAAAPTPVATPEEMKPSGAMEAVMSDTPADFYESAASANQFEIEASKLALARSQDADIKAFADTMVKDHAEIAQKLVNLATSKNVELPKELLRRHQVMLDGLKDEEAGKAFDDDYRMKMVLSHKETVLLFDQSAKESPDPDIRKFALATIARLQAHGGRAQKMQDKAKKKS
jgi:putative membrane protein